MPESQLAEGSRGAREDVGSATPWRRRGRYGLHVAGLACVALAQPLFDLIGRQDEFLVAHHLRSPEIAALAAILGWAVPAVAAFLVVAADLLSRRLGTVLYRAATGGLVSLVVLQALKDLPVPPFLPVVAALAAGTLFVLGLRSFRAFGSFLSLVAAALALFPALFLLRSPVSELLFPDPGTISAPPVTSDTPIVLVVFDELPLASLLAPGRGIDAKRFPAFDTLAAGSTWFRNATTVAYRTSLAIPAILTGRYPDKLHPHAAAYPRNLFTWLGASYRLNVFETASHLCPSELCPDPFASGPGERLRATLSDLVAVYPHVTLPPALTTWAPDVTATWGDFRGSSPDDEVAEHRAAGRVFERFLATLERSEEPTLSYLHVNLPHVPWKYLPSGKQYGPPGSRVLPHGLEGPNWRHDEWAVEQAYQRHLLQLAYTDRLLGRLLDRLRDTGLYERSLLVVVADHGASFQPGEPRRVVNDDNAAEILLVPLFVKLPFQEKGRVRDHRAQTIDIVPTLAEALGAEVPWEVAGRSLLSLDAPVPPRQIVRVGKAKEMTLHPVRGPRFSLLDAAIERKTDLFRQGLYNIGAFRGLLGTPPESHPQGSESRLGVELAEPEAFDDVDPEGAYLPAQVAGKLRSAPAPPYHLAVALNGEIRAVTRSYTGPNGEQFWAMLPESAFRKGFNRLELFEVDGGGAQVALSPIALNHHPR